VSFTRFLWKVSPLRATLEAAAVEAFFLILLLSDNRLTAIVWLTTGFLSAIAGLICAFRARLPNGQVVNVLAYEIGVSALLTVIMGMVVVAIINLLPQYLSVAGSFMEDAPWLLWAGATFLFFPVRIIMHLWRAWAAVQQRRLLWSVANAQLMTVLVILLLFLISQAWNLAATPGLGGEAAGPIAEFATRFTFTIAMLVAAVIISMPVVIAVMGVAALMSYFAARRITRRIDKLVQATTRLRSGDYSARLDPVGEDEIAQLEQDFNAMAATLEKTLTELRTERDTVSGLLQTRRELIAAVSHELRTPVATMRGYLESTLAGWQDAPPSTLRHDLEVMGREVNQLQGLIDDLFTLSRAEVGRLTLRCIPTNVAPVIQHVVETTAPLAWQSGRVKIVAELPPTLPLALVDAQRLEQILHNLIRNGIQHTPPGGIVALSAQSTTSGVEIAIRDTGSGIAPEILPHIWDRFYSMNTHNGGGLGLSVVKDLTEAMGGSVDVESTIGQGSCFRVCLPMSTAAS
jgi:signal transduction histidine kinase